MNEPKVDPSVPQPELKKQPRHKQVAVSLPDAYLRILQEEAKLYGLRPSQFAEQLLTDSLRPRRADAPKYDLEGEDLRRRTRFLWYVRRELVPLLDKKRLEFGGVSVTPVLVLALNRWLGLGPVLSSPSDLDPRMSSSAA